MSIPPIQWWVEPRNSSGDYADLTDITTSTSFRQSLDCWNQQILCRGSLHPTIMNLFCRANLTLCAAICLFCIEMSRLVCQWVWQYLHLKRIGWTKGVRCTRPEVYEDIEKGGCARSITLELQELAGSKLVPERDCAVQRSEVAKL